MYKIQYPPPPLPHQQKIIIYFFRTSLKCSPALQLSLIGEPFTHWKNAEQSPGTEKYPPLAEQTPSAGAAATGATTAAGVSLLSSAEASNSPIITAWFLLLKSENKIMLSFCQALVKKCFSYTFFLSLFPSHLFLLNTVSKSENFCLECVFNGSPIS